LFVEISLHSLMGSNCNFLGSIAIHHFFHRYTWIVECNATLKLQILSNIISAPYGHKGYSTLRVNHSFNQPPNPNTHQYNLLQLGISLPLFLPEMVTSKFGLIYCSNVANTQ
jgi:hypothetical protein